MRRITRLAAVLVAAALAGGAAPLAAQLSLGLSAGFVSSTLTGDGIEDINPESTSGFSAGAWLGVPLGTRLSLVPGAFYVQKGASGSPGVGTITLDVTYLEIPVLFSLRVTPDDSGVGVSLFAGPEIGIEIGCDATAEPGGTAACDDAGFDERQTLDFGALAGAGIQFPIGESLALMISGGIDLGLRTLDSSDAPEDVKNRAFFGSAAVVLPLGG